MSSKFRFELNSKGVRDLLRSDEMKSGLRRYAQRVKAAAGDGNEISEYTGASRANVSVYASTRKAKKDNLQNNTLLKALGSAKD